VSSSLWRPFFSYNFLVVSFLPLYPTRGLRDPPLTLGIHTFESSSNTSFHVQWLFPCRPQSIDPLGTLPQFLLFFLSLIAVLPPQNFEAVTSKSPSHSFPFGDVPLLPLLNTMDLWPNKNH